LAENKEKKALYFPKQPSTHNNAGGMGHGARGKEKENFLLPALCSLLLADLKGGQI
jgi:hypothetical protein